MDLKTTRADSMLLPLMAIWASVLVLVSPGGDFPLNDDWIYAQSVGRVLETGVYTGQYIDPVFVLQAYWGVFFVAVFGFSFTVLRFTTCIALLIAAWGASRCARSTGLSRSVSLLIGTLILVNPILLNLGYTFMTDVPFLALAHWSMYWYLRAIKSQRAIALAVGSAFAAGAYLIRQFGILLPISFLVTVAILWPRLRYGWNWKHIVAFVLPWCFTWGILQLLPDSASGLAVEFRWDSVGNTLGQKIANGLRHLFTHGVYLGLFLLPLMGAKIWVLLVRQEIWSRRKWVGLVLLAGVIGSTLLTTRTHRMPYTGNMLYDFGVGPILLRGIVVEGKLESPFQLGGLWWAVTVFGWLAAALLIFEVTGHVRAIYDKIRARFCVTDHPGNLFLLVTGSIFSFVLFIPGFQILFDRYYVMSLLPFAILFAQSVPWEGEGHAKRIGAVCAVLLYVVSVVCLQDYMAWNRARWTATTRLAEHYKAMPEQIDGGFEFNALYTRTAFLDRDSASSRRNYGPKGWWVVDDLYAVSMRRREGFEEIGRVGYFSWLGMTYRDILILRRIDEGEQ